MTKYACKLHLPDLFAYTITGETSSLHRVDNLWIIFQSNLLQGGFLWYLSFFLNIALCVDLILMIKYPFSPKESRMWKYLLICYLLSIGPGSSYFYLNLHEYEGVKRSVALMQGFVTFACMIAFIFFAVFSITYAFMKLAQPGIS